MQNNADDSQQSHPPRGKRSCPQDGQPQGTRALSVPNTAACPFPERERKQMIFSPLFFFFACGRWSLAGQKSGAAGGCWAAETLSGCRAQTSASTFGEPCGNAAVWRCCSSPSLPKGPLHSSGRPALLPPPALPPNLTPLSTGREGRCHPSPGAGSLIPSCCCGVSVDPGVPLLRAHGVKPQGRRNLGLLRRCLARTRRAAAVWYLSYPGGKPKADARRLGQLLLQLLWGRARCLHCSLPFLQVPPAAVGVILGSLCRQSTRPNACFGWLQSYTEVTLWWFSSSLPLPERTGNNLLLLFSAAKSLQAGQKLLWRICQLHFLASLSAQ